MTKVLAAVMPKPHAPVEVRELSEPELEADSALLEVELSEVCGTDVHLQQGRLAGVPYPLIPGHVSAGRLCKIRGRVLDVAGRPFMEGDRVTFLDVHRTCNACWYCLVAKATTRCPHRKVYGITYGLADGLTGGWAQKLYLKPGTRCIRLGEIDFEKFMAGGCALPTALHAVERAEVTLADTVLVLGSGPVGLSVVIFALMRGALRVLCIGAPEHRLEAAGKLGAATLNVETSDEKTREQWVLEQTEGRGADVTVEATGAPAAVVQAMRYTRDAGRVLIVGQYTDHGEVTFNPHLELNKKHLTVRGCWGSDFSHFYRGVQIMSDPARSEAWSLLKLDRYKLDGANEALAAVAAGKVTKALIAPQA
ncbi:MAG TPA: zinc-binding dehydrogenase [Pyrinomonadaceae bacterium]|nr:zinc-binding dehydrogenase [Pyrinomonadaceae bacterium]